MIYLIDITNMDTNLNFCANLLVVKHMKGGLNSKYIQALNLIVCKLLRCGCILCLTLSFMNIYT